MKTKGNRRRALIGMVLFCLSGSGRGQDVEEETQGLLVEQGGEVFFMPFLQAQGDGLTGMISFDWGLHFFRNRGRSGNFSRLMINGLSMNSLLDGSAPWKEIAGLNEQFRNRLLQRSEDLQEYGPPPLVETQLIELSPFNNRLQNKLVLSTANRFYRFRYGITSTQEFGEGKHRLTFSMTSRSGGILAPLRSLSYLAGWGHKPTDNKEWGVFLFGVSTQRGKSSPLSQEVYSLAGNDYNPNGGYWKGLYKSSREETFHRPLIHGFFKRETTANKFLISSAYQRGKWRSTRLGFRDAPHPSPAYYKYLPSYYRNKALGQRLDILEIESHFGTQPQLDWTALYSANRGNGSGSSHYALLGDIEQRSRLMTFVGYWRYGERSQLFTGMSVQRERSHYFQTPVELLGGQYWVNSDTFSQQSYDTGSDQKKTTGEITHHNYILSANQVEVSGHFIKRKESWVVQFGGRFSLLTGGRKGLFQNDMYPNSSLGSSKRLKSLGFGAFFLSKWNVNLRQQLLFSCSIQQVPSPLEQPYIERDFSNQLLQSDAVTGQRSISLEWRRRQQQWNGRFACFVNEVTGEVTSRSSYLETAYGEGLLTETVLDQRSLSLGIEGYIKWKLTSELHVDFGWQFRKDYWGNQPILLWTERPGTVQDRIFMDEGSFEAGRLDLKGVRRGLGPEKAFGIRLNYRSPDYWWIQTGIHSFWGNRVSPALNRYSDSFLLAVGGDQELSLSPQRRALIRQQEELPSVSYMHIAAGKSWKKERRYISLFLSLQNVLGAQVPTGGFQQNRVAHARLALEEYNSSTPLFGNKYWMSSGRTFFLNLSISF